MSSSSRIARDINKARVQALKTAEGKKNYKAPEDLKTQLSTYFQAKDENETTIAKKVIDSKTYEVTTGCKTDIPGACTPPSNAKGFVSWSLGALNINGTIEYTGETVASYLTANIQNFSLKEMEEAIKCTLGLSALPFANAMLDYVKNNSTLVTNIIRYVHGNFTVIHKLMDSPKELYVHINETVIPQIQAVDCYSYSSSSTGVFSSTGASNSTTGEPPAGVGAGTWIGLAVFAVALWACSAISYKTLLKYDKNLTSQNESDLPLVSLDAPKNSTSSQVGQQGRKKKESDLSREINQNSGYGSANEGIGKIATLH